MREIRGAGKGWSEGISSFAAKRGIGSDGRAPGIAAEMDGGGLEISYPPVPPLKGESSMCRGRFRPDIAAESPTARQGTTAIIEMETV